MSYFQESVSSKALRQYVSIPYSVLTLTCVVLIVGLFWVLNTPVTPTMGLLLAGSVGYLVGLSVNVVRTHPLFNLASGVVVLVFSYSVYTAQKPGGILSLGFALLAVVGIGVELYNYLD